MSDVGSDLKAIRAKTRLALPEDDGYLFRLGVAVYGFGSINSFMCEVIAHLDSSTNHTELQDKYSGAILKTFRKTVDIWTGADIRKPAKRAADEFERLHEERNDFSHAYPITSPTGEQILHRRRDKDGKYFEVTSAFLDDFISRLIIVSTALYEIRGIVRPNL